MIVFVPNCSASKRGPCARKGRVHTVTRVIRSGVARSGVSRNRSDPCSPGAGLSRPPPQPSSAVSKQAAPAPVSTCRRPIRSAMPKLLLHEPVRRMSLIVLLAARRAEAREQSIVVRPFIVAMHHGQAISPAHESERGDMRYALAVTAERRGRPGPRFRRLKWTTEVTHARSQASECARTGSAPDHGC